MCMDQIRVFAALRFGAPALQRVGGRGAREHHRGTETAPQRGYRRLRSTAATAGAEASRLPQAEKHRGTERALQRREEESQHRRVIRVAIVGSSTLTTS